MARGTSSRGGPATVTTFAWAPGKIQILGIAMIAPAGGRGKSSRRRSATTPPFAPARLS